MARQVENSSLDRSKTCRFPPRIRPGPRPGDQRMSWRQLLADYRRCARASGKAAAVCGRCSLQRLRQHPPPSPMPWPRGFRARGCGRGAFNCEFRPRANCSKPIRRCDALLYRLAPPLAGHCPHTPIVSDPGHPAGPKPTGAQACGTMFGSYGWSGEAIDLRKRKLRDGAFRFRLETIRVKFSPDGVAHLPQR